MEVVTKSPETVFPSSLEEYFQFSSQIEYSNMIEANAHTLTVSGAGWLNHKTVMHYPFVQVPDFRHIARTSRIYNQALHSQTPSGE